MKGLRAAADPCRSSELATFYVYIPRCDFERHRGIVKDSSHVWLVSTLCWVHSEFGILTFLQYGNVLWGKSDLELLIARALNDDIESGSVDYVRNDQVQWSVVLHVTRRMRLGAPLLIADPPLCGLYVAVLCLWTWAHFKSGRGPNQFYCTISFTTRRWIPVPLLQPMPLNAGWCHAMGMTSNLSRCSANP